MILDHLERCNWPIVRQQVVDDGLQGHGGARYGARIDQNELELGTTITSLALHTKGFTLGGRCSTHDTAITDLRLRKDGTGVEYPGVVTGTTWDKDTVALRGFLRELSRGYVLTVGLI